MNEHLIAWDFVINFTGQDAALAIIGRARSDDPANITNASPALELMHRAYEGTRRWFADSPGNTDTPPLGMLVSVEMLAEKGRVNPALELIDAGDWTFLLWLRTPNADFARQHFAPAAIAKWLQEINRPSVYSFVSHPQFSEDTKDALSTPTNDNPKARTELDPSNWKMKIQAEATALFLRLYESGANPTVSSTKDDLAKWCQKNNVRTDTGIFPNAQYLRSHVLSGKHWKKPDRPLKRKEQTEQTEQTEQVNFAQPEKQ